MAAVVVHQEVTAAVLVTLVAPQTPVILSQVSVMDTKKHFIILFYLAIILGVQSNSVSRLDLSFSPVILLYGSRNPNSRCITCNVVCIVLLLAKECRMCYFH